METFRAAWQRATVANPSNVAVLRNAARFYIGEDVRAAMTALRRARVVDGRDVRLVQDLNLVEFQAWMAGGTEREELLRLLADSRDAAELGDLGRMLVNQRHSPMTRDTAGWAAEGVKLLERAKALEPSNPKWTVGLELARLGAVVRMPGAPVMPEEALQVRGVAAVTLRLRVAGDGTVREAVALEGEPLLLAAAVQSAMKDKLEARGQEYEVAGVVMFRRPDGQGSAGMPMRITVGGNVQQAMLAEKVDPEYPPLARQARIQGVVRFTVTLGEDGRVVNMTLVSGHPLLVQAAQDAVKQWRYKPTTLNGQAVQVTTQVEVPFTMTQ
ncbi:MAG: energy transducer TonB [Bryobacterales bacterium]|nr:energy transducer TonB [Bryobacterales bacterium]